MGDPSGACSCSGWCTSSEAELDLTGDLVLREGPWYEPSTFLRVGGREEVQGRPLADFGDTEVEFQLTGQQRTAPLIAYCNGYGDTNVANWTGTVRLGNYALLDVAIVLDGGVGEHDYHVAVDGHATVWREVQST